jgi:hypothetical protein
LSLGLTLAEVAFTPPRVPKRLKKTVEADGAPRRIPLRFDPTADKSILDATAPWAWWPKDESGNFVRPGADGKAYSQEEMLAMNQEEQVLLLQQAEAAVEAEAVDDADDQGEDQGEEEPDVDEPDVDELPDSEGEAEPEAEEGGGESVSMDVEAQST